MKKLRLDLNDLAVESFQLGDSAATHRGTVDAHVDPFSMVEGACADTDQSNAYTCATCPPVCAPQDDVEHQRRIILY